MKSLGSTKKGKLVVNKKPYSRQKTEHSRLMKNFALTPLHRWKKAFSLMSLSLAFKRGSLKVPQGKGLLLGKSAA